MKISEILSKNHINETSSAGSTSSGNIATVSAPMAGIIKRIPPGQSFFYPVTTTKKAKKRNKKEQPS